MLHAYGKLQQAMFDRLHEIFPNVDAIMNYPLLEAGD